MWGLLWLARCGFSVLLAGLTSRFQRDEALVCRLVGDQAEKKSVRKDGAAATLTLTLSCDHRALDGATASAANPFDRMLIAQAQVESLVLVSTDRIFALYDVALLT